MKTFLTSRAVWAIGIIALILGAVVAYIWGTGGWLGRFIGGWMWPVPVLVLIIGGLIWVQRFLPRYRERRFLEELRTRQETAPGDRGIEEDRQLSDKMLEAVRILRSSPEIRRAGGLPLYALPWFMVIGPHESGKTTLLRSAASLFSPFARPSTTTDGPTHNCDWWFFNTAVILDTSGTYAFPQDVGHDSARWFRFLQLLKHYRELQPINGMIISVAADSLASKNADELRRDAGELRKRIDETIRELGVEFPVYLLITRCDLIEGFTEFFGRLPEKTRTQVFGAVNDTPSQPGDGQPLGFEPMFESIQRRLYHLRLSLLREKLPSATLRQKIFCFPEEFRALQTPLTTFADTLFAKNPYQHTPFFRGCFFCSAQQQGTPMSLLRRELHFNSQGRALERDGKARGYFLHDLLADILPRDRYLTRSTARATSWRRLRDVFSFGACLVVFGLAVVFLVRASLSDRQMLASIDAGPCSTALGQADISRLLDQAAACRLTVQGLIDQRQQGPTWSRLFFDRSGTMERQLRERFVENFNAAVLTPLDASIDDQLTSGAETIPLVFVLINRIELINQCLSTPGCPASSGQEPRPDYQLMLDPAQRRRPEPDQAAKLRDTYEAYVSWISSSGDGLPRELEAHAVRLRQWFSARQFAPRQILLWANQHYAPVTLQTFWTGPAGGNGRKGPQVEGAYTSTAWKQSILPFLQRAADAVPDLEVPLKEFQTEYRSQYFEQWRRFLAEFPQGELPWWRTREQRRQLALKLLDDQSPYNRVLDATFDQLKPLLPLLLVAEVAVSETATSPAGGRISQFFLKTWQSVSQLWSRRQPTGESVGPATAAESVVPAWVQVLQRYIRSDSRKAYVSVLKEVQQQLGDDVPLEQSFQLAQSGFQEGRPTEKSAHPVFRAWWVVSKFREQEGAERAALDGSFWPLLERPVLFAWKVILDGAGQFLQRAWADNVLAPTKGLSDMEQLDFLYGPQGKVREFVDKFAKLFLTDNESRLGQVLGEEIPLGPAFLKVLRDERQVKPILELGKRTPHRVRVEAGRESVIDSQTNVQEEKSEFQLECEAKTFKVSNRPTAGVESSTIVFWTAGVCGDVIIAVSMACDRKCVERAAAVGISVPELSSLRVAKRYRGQTAFLRFLQDFSGVSRTFTRGDFADSYPPDEWQKLDETLRRYRISAIKMAYRTEVPATLSNLMAIIPTIKPPAALTR